MTTLEKLCRAACEADFKNPDTPVRVEELVNWQLYVRPVLAVLTALEDPSGEMVKAGLAAPEHDWTDVELKGRFTAMIRKAKEG